MPENSTIAVQWRTRLRMLCTTGPSSSMRFHCLSNDGFDSFSSGNGRVFREERSAKLPLIQVQLLLRKGVGRPTQILPPRSSSSAGFTRAAAAPWGSSATPCGWSNCACMTSSMALSPPTRWAMAHSASVEESGFSVTMFFCVMMELNTPGFRSGIDCGSPLKNAAYASGSFTFASCAAMSLAPLWNSSRRRLRVKRSILSAISDVFVSSLRTVGASIETPRSDRFARNASLNTVGNLSPSTFISKGAWLSGKASCSFSTVNWRPRLMPGFATNFCVRSKKCKRPLASSCGQSQ
mmetsp:Transcript_37486/g.107099  ORF Transcript_37486/g.107099 Transcript_37486/m.107099 type:complete len:294 (+) Transcript_37486:2970-3851(+)